MMGVKVKALKSNCPVTRMIRGQLAKQPELPPRELLIEPDYKGYVESQKRSREIFKGLPKPMRTFKIMSKVEYLADFAEENERITKAQAERALLIKRGNCLLFRTKHSCVVCGGNILHRYEYYTPPPVATSDLIIGGCCYEEISVPSIKDKVHYAYYCKQCGLEYNRLTKATLRIR